MSALTGVTWGHRRAIDPLLAASKKFADLHGGQTVDWRVRTLQDFEHQSIEQVARTADLVVFDHPFVGRIEASGVFRALEEIGVSPPPDVDFIGRSAETYRWGGKTWAVPVDGATIHAIYRADNEEVSGPGAPRSWMDFLDLARRLRKSGKWAVIAATGHHGLLTLMSLCANAGAPWTAPMSRLLEEKRDILEDCIDTFREGVSLCHPSSLSANAIDVHDAMSENAEFAYCPAAYGYATYGEADRAYRLSFAPFPGIRAPFEAGTMIGGAGVGISATCENVDDARNFLDFLLLHSTQRLFAEHHGQPAHRGCWTDPVINSRFNKYFSATRETTASAQIRPRFLGYQSFETRMGEALNAYLASRITKSELFDHFVSERPITLAQ